MISLVCVFVCYKDYSKSSGQICMNLFFFYQRLITDMVDRRRIGQEVTALSECSGFFLGCSFSVHRCQARGPAS